MLRAIFSIAFVALVTAEKTSFENYKVFRIVPTTEEQLKALQQLESSFLGVSTHFMALLVENCDF